jgi:hypothetical protein
MTVLLMSRWPRNPLNRPRIHALLREVESLGVPEHVRVHRERQPDLLSCPLHDVVDRFKRFQRSKLILTAAIDLGLREVTCACSGITRRCRLNDLRHSFASNLASESLSLLDIRDALGHTTVRMSEGYAKPNEHAVDRLRTPSTAVRSASAVTPGVTPKHKNQGSH